MLLSAAALAGCGGSGIPPVSSGERYVSAPEFSEQYRLGVGDKVRVSVYNEPQLGGEYAVGSNGELSLPLIGTVVVGGKTPEQATALIQAGFANGYLRDPRVSLEITAYRPFFILGEVQKPGQYPYLNSLTVVNAIATAEGFTPRAKKKTVMIRRFGEQAEVEYVLTPDLRVWPGDTIRLTERYF
jgi:polysaccharide export outer membrane protein